MKYQESPPFFTKGHDMVRIMHTFQHGFAVSTPPWLTSLLRSTCCTFHSEKVLIASCLSRCLPSACVRLDMTWSLRWIDVSYVWSSSFILSISFWRLARSEAELSKYTGKIKNKNQLLSRIGVLKHQTEKKN